MHFEENASEASLSEGISALKAGKKSDAERLLKLAVRQRPDSAQAWLWLGAAVSTPGETLFCLERVLQLDPDNERARSGIGWTRSQHSTGELAAVDPLANDQNTASPGPEVLSDDSTFGVDNVQNGEKSQPRQPAFEAAAEQPAIAEPESMGTSFLPKLIIAGLSLTLLLGILIIIALLRAWLG